MASASMEWEQPRDRLARLILDAIQAWPERDRRIFIAARYRGRSLDGIAHDLAMTPADVRLVVEECERRLYGSLRHLRREGEAGAPAAGRRGRLRCLLRHSRV